MSWTAKIEALGRLVGFRVAKIIHGERISAIAAVLRPVCAIFLVASIGSVPDAMAASAPRPMSAALLVKMATIFDGSSAQEDPQVVASAFHEIDAKGGLNEVFRHTAGMLGVYNYYLTKMMIGRADHTALAILMYLEDRAVKIDDKIAVIASRKDGSPDARYMSALLSRHSDGVFKVPGMLSIASGGDGQRLYGLLRQASSMADKIPEEPLSSPTDLSAGDEPPPMIDCSIDMMDGVGSMDCISE